MGHHVVPQRYLRAFEVKDRPGFIWMFDKEKKTAKCLPIKQVAQVPGFYANDVEAALNTEAEIPGNDVIDKLKKGEPLEEIDRKHLTYYIATMMTRTPAARARANTFVPGALDSVASDVKQAIEDAAALGIIDEETKQNRLVEAEQINSRFQKQPPPQVTKVIETPWPYQSWLLAIHSMTWRVVESRGPSYFLTSDHPVTLLGQEGLETRDCELTLPLSTELLLHCSWQGDEEVERLVAPQSFVKEFNRRTVFGAHRFVFYHQNAPWVTELLRNKSPQLNRIDWLHPAAR